MHVCFKINICAYIYVCEHKGVKLSMPRCQVVNPEVSEWRLLFLENTSLSYCTCYNEHT